MSEFLTFKVELEIDSSTYMHDRAGGPLHELYIKWVDGGKRDEDWEPLSEFIDNELETGDIQFWVEDVRLIK